VTNGDVLTGLDLKEVIEAHQGSGALATITLTTVEDPTSYGLVEIDHQLRVRRFVEKPSYDKVSINLVNCGIYVLEREVLNIIPAGRDVSIEREIFPELQAMGKLRAYVSSAYWQDIDTPEGYLQASHDTLSGAVGRSEDFEYLSVHPSVRISQGVTLIPPVSIAEGCEVETRATIGGRTAFGERCVVEEVLWWRVASSSKRLGCRRERSSETRSWVLMRWFRRTLSFVGSACSRAKAS
jgi:mannose-1-phosphate guanylyltransferase